MPNNCCLLSHMCVKLPSKVDCGSSQWVIGSLPIVPINKEKKHGQEIQMYQV